MQILSKVVDFTPSAVPNILVLVRDFVYHGRYTESYRLSYSFPDDLVLKQYVKGHSKGLTAHRLTHRVLRGYGDGYMYRIGYGYMYFKHSTGIGYRSGFSHSYRFGSYLERDYYEF